MFTGIITHIGTVVDCVEGKACRHFTLKADIDFSTLKLGASIAHDGVCLSVTHCDGTSYGVTAASETLQVTTLKDWTIGKKINLERALKVGDELGGHIVSGHVDGLAKLMSCQEVGESYILSFSVPDPLHRFIAEKGSVALDGISLTINGVKDDVFDVCIIPVTWAHTTLKDKKVGDFLHLEVDRLARYAARYSDTNKGDLS